MKYLYKVGYGSYEDSAYAELTHETCYSEEELHKLIVNAIIKVLESIMDNQCKVSLDEEGVSYEEIHDHVITELIVHDGFKKVAYQAQWSCFGWPSIVSEDSWKGQRDETLNKIYSEIPEKLRTAIIERGTNEYNERWTERRVPKSI